jgi:molybdate transport system substrate-binding protein
MKKFALSILCILMTVSAYAETITVFAATTTVNAVNEISRIYTEKTGVEIRSSFASSGTLAKQIQNSAPAEIFISANEKWMKWLADENLIASGTYSPLLSNRLALIAPLASEARPTELKNAEAAMILQNASKVAIGDPSHSPAGIYAENTIRSLGIWDKIEKNLVRMQTVRIVLAAVEQNAVPLGIVYSSDAAQSQKVKILGIFDESLHNAIRYPIGIVAGKNTPAVKAFYDFLKSDEASQIFRNHGFLTVR